MAEGQHTHSTEVHSGPNLCTVRELRPLVLLRVPWCSTSDDDELMMVKRTCHIPQRSKPDLSISLIIDELASDLDTHQLRTTSEPSVNGIKNVSYRVRSLPAAPTDTVNSSRALHNVAAIGADELIPHAVQTIVTYSNLRAAGLGGVKAVKVIFRLVFVTHPSPCPMFVQEN